MADKQWNHRLHGDDLHDLVIFLVERHVIENNGVIKPTRDFKGKKICPCEPDVYFSIDTKLIDGNKRIHQKGLYVVEVETRATNESRLTKFKQYRESLAGLTDLIVIDLDKEYWEWIEKKGIHNPQYHDWTQMRDYIKERMPI